MRDKGPVGKIEAILIAQRIIETCTQCNYTGGCVQCPFRSSPDRGCWLEGLKVDIAELDIVEAAAPGAVTLHGKEPGRTGRGFPLLQGGDQEDCEGGCRHPT